MLSSTHTNIIKTITCLLSLSWFELVKKYTKYVIIKLSLAFDHTSPKVCPEPNEEREMKIAEWEQRIFEDRKNLD